MSQAGLLISWEKKKKRIKEAVQPFCILNGLRIACAQEISFIPTEAGETPSHSTALSCTLPLAQNQQSGTFRTLSSLGFFFSNSDNMEKFPSKYICSGSTSGHQQWGFGGNSSGISLVCAFCASPGSEALARAEMSTGRFVQFCCAVLCQRCPRLDFTKLLLLKGSWILCLTSRGISLTGLQCLCSLGGVEQSGGKCGF